MKKLYILSFILFFGTFSQGFAQHAFLEQGVINKLTNADPNELIPILMEMEDVVDVEALKADFISREIPVNKRAELLMIELKSKASTTQPAVVSFIENSGMAYTDLEQFWIANFIALKASPELIASLAGMEAIGRIGLNTRKFSLIEPKKGTLGGAKSVGGIEPGLVAIGAPEMWAMGYTGQSRLALTFDTGAWPDHPAFENRYLVNRMPLDQAWFGYDSAVPVDKSDSHGTHVSGTILGLDTATADTIGVAFGAYLIATDPIVQNLSNVKPLTELLLGYQWALNPDGDISTSMDIPDVINNSWGLANASASTEWPLCPVFWTPVMEAVAAAGIANVFSAGNEGPGDATIGIPQNTNTGLVNSFSVGAVSASNPGTGYFPIAEFSSRGPSLCGGEGSLLIKPEVSAPGVNVRSSVGHGEYDVYSGTSMASPHVSGAVLLLKEAFPYLSGEAILLALYNSAADLGVPGEDNTYGMGMINVKAAYDYLALTNEPVPPASHNVDLELVEIIDPSEIIACGDDLVQNMIAPSVVIRNNGTTDITGINIHYTLNGQNETEYSNTEIVLTAGTDTEIDLPLISAGTYGSKELHIWILPLEEDYDKFNNHNVFRWKILPMEAIYPITTETFEDGIDSAYWTIQNLDGYITWDTLSVIQANGEVGVAAWMNFRNYSPSNGQKDNLFTPTLYAQATDVSYFGVNLSFDLFYRRKTSNQFLQDTLAIYFKESCGLNQDSAIEVFRRGGDSLYSVPEGDSDALPLDSTEWQHYEMTIPFENSDIYTPYFYLQFQAINQRGNHLLLDNINVSLEYNVGINDLKNPEIKLYPNPTNDWFTIETDGTDEPEKLEIYDVLGRKIASYPFDRVINKFSISGLPQSIYVVRIQWKNSEADSTVRLVIQ